MLMAVKNTPPFKLAVNTLEARVVQTPHRDATAGKAACPFEARATQEGGQH